MIKEIEINKNAPGKEWTEVNSEHSDLEFVNLIVNSFQNLGFDVYVQEILDNPLNEDNIYKVFLKLKS